MRAVSRVVDVSFNTVAKALIDAGTVCAEMHDELVRDVKSSRIECDEIWAFSYCKQRTVPLAKAAPDDAGDPWTWTGIDADSKLIVSYLVGDRSGQAAMELMDDLRSRLANRVQITTDGHRAYLEAVEGAFGADVDYAQMGEKAKVVFGAAAIVGASIVLAAYLAAPPRYALGTPGNGTGIYRLDRSTGQIVVCGGDRCRPALFLPVREEAELGPPRVNPDHTIDAWGNSN